MIKKNKTNLTNIVTIVIKFLPDQIKEKIVQAIDDFADGIVLLKQRIHFAYALIATIGIWLGYAITYYLCLKAFDIDSTYALPWYAGLVVLVITTISLFIPSTPGNIGTFHLLCQVSLATLGVSGSIALSYATVAHAVMVTGVLCVGVVLANMEGIKLIRFYSEQKDMGGKKLNNK